MHTQAGVTGVQGAASQDIAVMVMEPLRGDLVAIDLELFAQATTQAI